MDENNKQVNEISDEEKDMILLDTKRYTDELENLEKMHDSINNENIEFDSKDKSKNEKYDIEKNRTNIKHKERSINRKLGYKRKYLNSDVKISNVVLLIIFIVLSIMVIGKYALPNDLGIGVNNSQIVEESTQFGSQIYVYVGHKYQNDNLIVNMTIENKEKENIKFNPEAIKLINNETIYVPTVSNEHKKLIPTEGIKPNEKVTFDLIFNTNEGSTTNPKLETIVLGNSETCILVTSIGL